MPPVAGVLMWNILRTACDTVVQLASAGWEPTTRARLPAIASGTTPPSPERLTPPSATPRTRGSIATRPRPSRSMRSATTPATAPPQRLAGHGSGEPAGPPSPPPSDSQDPASDTATTQTPCPNIGPQNAGAATPPAAEPNHDGPPTSPSNIDRSAPRPAAGGTSPPSTAHPTAPSRAATIRINDPSVTTVSSRQEVEHPHTRAGAPVVELPSPLATSPRNRRCSSPGRASAASGPGNPRSATGQRHLVVPAP